MSQLGSAGDGMDETEFTESAFNTDDLFSEYEVESQDATAEVDEDTTA